MTRKTSTSTSTSTSAKRGRVGRGSGTKPKALAKYPGVPCVYIRYLANGGRLYYRTKDAGKYAFTSLNLNDDAPIAEVVQAAERAKRRLTAPETDFDAMLDRYFVARGLKETSAKGYRKALDGFTLDDARNAAKMRELSRRDLSDASKRDYIARIRAVFGWMIKQGVEVKDPTDGWKLPKSEPRECPLTAEDATRLIADVDADGTDGDRLFVRLLRYTGARVSTVCALRSADFDAVSDGTYRAHMYNVKAARRYKIDSIPITDPSTCALIRERLKRRPVNFWDTETETLDRLKMRLWRRMRKLFGKGVMPHGLRHLAACEMLQAGVPLDLVSKALDHADVSITLKVYARHSQSQIDEAFNRLS